MNFSLTAPGPSREAEALGEEAVEGVEVDLGMEYQILKFVVRVRVITPSSLAHIEQFVPVKPELVYPSGTRLTTTHRGIMPCSMIILQQSLFLLASSLPRGGISALASRSRSRTDLRASWPSSAVWVHRGPARQPGL